MKKNRRISFVLLFIMVVSIFHSDNFIIHAKDDQISEEMQLAYDQTIKYAPNWKETAISEFDVEDWNAYKILVIDGSFEKIPLSENPLDSKTHTYFRFIGYSPDGLDYAKINNPDYPDDNTGSESINGYDWQKNEDALTMIGHYKFTAEYIDYFLDGMFKELESRFGTRFNRNIGPHGGTPKDWLDYAHIIVPPTRYSRGVVRFEHLWDKHKDGHAESWYITVNLDPINLPPEPVDPEPDEDVEVVGIDDMTTNASAIIQADARGAEKFDVAKGIPTTESLYANVDARTYIHKEDFEKVTGYKEYQVKVTKEYKVTRTKTVADKDGNPVKKTYTKTIKDYRYIPVRRNYSYYKINNLSLYSLDKATLVNEALPSGTVELHTGISRPTLIVSSDGNESAHLEEPSAQHSVEIGRNGSFSDAAEDAVGEFRVRNDSLVFNGQVIMDSDWYDVEAPAPGRIPDAPMNGPDDLYIEGQQIQDTLTNGVKASSGTLSYHLVGSTDSGTPPNISESIPNVNAVTVHTPVVCYPSLSEISLPTQYLTPESDRHQLVIEETFRLDYPTDGEHLSIQGYGNRDYADYTYRKQIAFPFDVYVGDGYDGLFVPKNTWANFNSPYRTFFIPAWVDESVGDIMFRTLPINLPSIDDQHYEYHANTEITNYKAVEKIPYRINGKLEAFSITRCPDDYWKYAFNNPTAPKSPKPRMGARLPLVPSESTTIQGKNIALQGIMLGYPVDFSFITNGDLLLDEDTVSVAVTWSYAPDKNGKPDLSQQQPVDLYRMTSSSLIPMEDKRLTLTSSDRTFIGIQGYGSDAVGLPAEISSQTAKTSRQYWEGQFLLPNMTYAVPKGTPVSSMHQVDVNKAPFLHNGYLFAHVKVFGQKDGRDYMEYGTMWEREGYKSNALSGLSDGDLFFYSTDRRASGTYR